MKYHPDRNPDNTKPKRNLKKLLKLMKFYRMPKNAACMIVWGQLPSEGGMGGGGGFGGFSAEDIFSQFGDILVVHWWRVVVVSNVRVVVQTYAM